MTTNDAVSQKAQIVQRVASEALGSDNSQNFEEFDRQVRELESMAREAFQAKYNNVYKDIIVKLEKGTNLSSEEFEILKLLVIGDAEYFIKYENDLQNWKDELARLTAEIEKLESDDLDNVDNLLHMQALSRDVRNVLPAITFYYREKERIARFETAAAGPVDDESKKIMADVIKSMISSSKM